MNNNNDLFDFYREPIRLEPIIDTSERQGDNKTEVKSMKTDIELEDITFQYYVQKNNKTKGKNPKKYEIKKISILVPQNRMPLSGKYKSNDLLLSDFKVLEKYYYSLIRLTEKGTISDKTQLFKTVRDCYNWRNDINNRTILRLYKKYINIKKENIEEPIGEQEIYESEENVPNCMCTCSDCINENEERTHCHNTEEKCYL